MIAASLARDTFVLLGVPALVYAGVVAAGAWAVGRRIGRARGTSFGLPAVGGVLLTAAALSAFAGFGSLVADGGDPTTDAFVGWGRIVLVFIYAGVVIGSALTARSLARRVGASAGRYAAIAAVTVFFFVWISAPFASIVNACHVGDAILINTTVNCR